MTATDRLRALLDERGVEWEEVSAEHTTWDDGHCWFYDDGTGWTFWGKAKFGTPEQAVEATLGPSCEPPIAAHWDGDVLVLTTPRDPSSIHIQRAEGQPRKVYPAEATLERGECRITSAILLHDPDGYETALDADTLSICRPRTSTIAQVAERRLSMIADKTLIVEEHVTLPIDAIGQTIRPGARVTHAGKLWVVWALVLNEAGWLLDCQPRDGEPPAGRTVRPEDCVVEGRRTVEDVLREFAEAIDGQNEDFGSLVVKRYANEIRKILGVQS